MKADRMPTLTNKALAERIHADIDKFCVASYSDEHRSHLGASVIGHDCARYVWYSFRWIKTEIFSGRMLRLFNRGHLEEARWIGWLRGIGMTVWEVDPNTGKQFRIWGAKGHYGGSTDSVAQLPYPEVKGENFLCEFKTHNYKSFKHLVEKGLVLAKPRHYAQMCSYGRHYGFTRGIYCASGKNDDDIHIEVVDLNFEFADDLQAKAGDIIFAQVPPPKIALQASYFECKMCPFRGPCHEGETIERNCRSCTNAVAVANAEWQCQLNGQIIPPDFIKVGCTAWKPIV